MYQDATTKKWYPAKITKHCEEPRSYIISTEEGAQYRKTQKHLKQYHPTPQIAMSHHTNNCSSYIQLRSKDTIKPPKKY